MLRTVPAALEMFLHGLMLDTRQGVIDERNVTISESATVHPGQPLRCPSVHTPHTTVPSDRALFGEAGHGTVERGGSPLLEMRLYQRGEGVACPVKSRFHCAQVAGRDFRDFLVRLPFELAQNEDLAVMAGQLGNSVFD